MIPLRSRRVTRCTKLAAIPAGPPPIDISYLMPRRPQDQKRNDWGIGLGHLPKGTSHFLVAPKRHPTSRYARPADRDAAAALQSRRGPGIMSTTEQDISWGMLRQVVRDWAGGDAELCEFSPLHGGSI